MADNSESLPIFYKSEKKEVIKVIILALAVGILIPLLSELISKWIVIPIFCQDPNNISICTNGGMVSYYISAVLVSIAAVSLLVNMDVNRPLLIAFGALLALWGLKGFMIAVANHNFAEYLAVSAILYAACYMLFYWCMRMRSFGVSLFLASATVMIVRWVLLV